MPGVQNPQLPPEIKVKLKENIGAIKSKMDALLHGVDMDDHCVLCEFEDIQVVLRELHASAATYYLKSYLAPFTENYLALSIAIQNLADRRHGALIVVQRNDSLDSLIHSGIPIGATLSHSLIESVFYPGGPLHDGAVLVHGNHMVSASNVLPLSMTPAGETKLGTRHRAAMGLTEHCDALVLVVSEETGRASFALAGSLYPINSSDFNYQ